MNNNKIVSVYIFISIIASIFILRLAYFQLVTDKYILNAFNTSIKKQVIRPLRGYIYDRNEKLIVTNSSTYELSVTPNLITEKFDTIKFCALLEITKADFIDRLIKVRKFSPIMPSPFIRFIIKEKAANIQEKLYNFPEFELNKMTQRDYLVNGSGNLLGYIGEVGKSLIDKNPNYASGDFIGITGVEKSYENVLKGIKGIKYFKVNINGKEIGLYNNGEEDVKVKSGTDITITIDSELQNYAEELIKNKRGGIVAIEPETGEILTLVSSPVINPQLFVGINRRKNISNLLLDSINRPLFDRSILAQYPPGSPFKLLTALASFQMGTSDTLTTNICHHGYLNGRKKIGCHCNLYYRPITIKQAIQNSCNSYFLNTYKRILKKDSTNIEKNIDQWNEIMTSFGLGRFLNNDLASGSKGLIPNSAYYNKRIGEKKWNSSRIIANGMGQGEILMTPIQLALVASAIANRGFFYIPHIIKKIGKSASKIESKFNKKHFVKVDKKHFEPIVEGMSSVIIKGTGAGIKSPLFSQAGKTGTAQNPHGQDHSIFIMFAPVEKPKIAIAVFIENGHYGATWAAPIASLIAEKYLLKEVKRKYLEDRMKNGSLNYEYKNQWYRHLKAIGKFEELVSIPDSIKRDSILKIKNKLKVDSINKLNLTQKNLSVKNNKKNSQN